MRVFSCTVCGGLNLPVRSFWHDGGHVPLGLTSNLVFSELEKVFSNPMATAAAIDRIVHHSVILEFDVPSCRTHAAQNRQTEKKSDRPE